MKKKGILIALVLIISFGMFFIAQNFQSKIYSQKNEIKSEKKMEENKNSEVKDSNNEKENQIESNKQSSNNSAPQSTNINITNSTTGQKPSNNQNINTNTSTNNQTQQNTQPAQAPTINQQSPVIVETKTNFYIIDTVNNKTITTSAENFVGSTVGNITKKVLDSKGIGYRVTPDGYFSMISGLKEKDPKIGALSGWCFYINGKKASVGASSYIPKKDDTVEWKYLKDGTLN